MADTDLSRSTLKPSRGKRDARSWRVPSLTILFHAGDPARVGEVARLLPLLEGRACALSRLEPLFGSAGESGGKPLADRHLSRTPAQFVLDGDGVRLESTGDGLRADGAPLPAARRWSRSELQQGVVLEMAEWVVLLLHLLGPAQPRQPDLGMVGESEAMQRVRAEVRRVGQLEVPVLLRGENGTGKELVARAIAANSSRAKGPFVAVNLAAIPASMAASELFGHVAGAFTGAARAHPGFFGQADHGTLFLDEVGAAPLDVQAMLLRVLETREVQPLGGERPRAVDLRVLSATDENLEEAMGAGRFREALFHRLAGYQLEVPPLRERRDDLGALLQHFLRQELRAAGEESRATLSWLQPALMARLARADWPGNVRQLANVARRIVLATRGGTALDEEVVPVQKAPPSTRAPDPPPETPRQRPPITQEELRAALKDHQWRIGAAARALGISRSSLYALIEASGGLRKARDLSAQELSACLAACGGDVDAMAQRLEVSGRGIRLRLKELGLS